MPIVISKVGVLYEADVTPPHGSGVPWHSPRLVEPDALVAKLLELGCNQTDIGDAFYAADPDWLSQASAPPLSRDIPER